VDLRQCSVRATQHRASKTPNRLWTDDAGSWSVTQRGQFVATFGATR
jgi:hypothetical protein